MLNLDTQPWITTEYDIWNSTLVTYEFDLSKKIIVEGRTVKSLPEIFGDLIGFYEIFLAAIAFLIGRL